MRVGLLCCSYIFSATSEFTWVKYNLRIFYIVFPWKTLIKISWTSFRNLSFAAALFFVFIDICGFSHTFYLQLTIVWVFVTCVPWENRRFEWLYCMKKMLIGVTTNWFFSWKNQKLVLLYSLDKTEKSKTLLWQYLDTSRAYPLSAICFVFMMSSRLILLPN